MGLPGSGGLSAAAATGEGTWTAFPSRRRLSLGEIGCASLGWESSPATSRRMEGRSSDTRESECGASARKVWVGGSEATVVAPPFAEGEPCLRSPCESVRSKAPPLPRKLPLLMPAPARTDGGERSFHGSVASFHKGGSNDSSEDYQRIVRGVHGEVASKEQLAAGDARSGAATAGERVWRGEEHGVAEGVARPR